VIGKDLTTDLGLGSTGLDRPTPTASVRAVEGKGHRSEDDDKSRRRRVRKMQEDPEDGALQEPDEPVHNFDDYA